MNRGSWDDPIGAVIREALGLRGMSLFSMRRPTKRWELGKAYVRADSTEVERFAPFEEITRCDARQIELQDVQLACDQGTATVTL